MEETKLIRWLVAIVALQCVAIAGLGFAYWRLNQGVTLAVQMATASSLKADETQRTLREVRADAAETRCFITWISLGQTESRAIYPTQCERSVLRTGP